MNFRIALIGLLFLAGCGGGTEYPIVVINGTIGYENGDKLPAGTKVLFNPALGGAGSSMAVTDADGNFSIEHATGVDGIETGAYLIELRAPDGQEAEFYKKVPAKYTDGGELSVDVDESTTEVKLILK